MTEDLFHNPEALRQLTAYGQDGELIGEVEQVYVDDRSGRPEWVMVRTEPPGEEERAGGTFVPLSGADATGDGRLRLACSADAVRTAPRMEAEQHLGLGQEQELYLHFGLTPPADEASGAPGVGDGRPKAPVTGDEKDLEGVKELAGEPAAPAPRLRKFVPTDTDSDSDSGTDSATAGSSGVRGEGR
jgi:hypothetical protein